MKIRINFLAFTVAGLLALPTLFANTQTNVTVYGSAQGSANNCHLNWLYTGSDYCQEWDNADHTANCVPVFNASQDNLVISSPGYSPGPLTPCLDQFFLNLAPGPTELGIEMTVTNETTGKVIFSGFAKNQVGLYCKKNVCNFWGNVG